MNRRFSNKKFTKEDYDISDGPAKKLAREFFESLGYVVEIPEKDAYNKGDIFVFKDNKKLIIEVKHKEDWKETGEYDGWYIGIPINDPKYAPHIVPPHDADYLIYFNYHFNTFAITRYSNAFVEIETIGPGIDRKILKVRYDDCKWYTKTDEGFKDITNDIIEFHSKKYKNFKKYEAQKG